MLRFMCDKNKLSKAINVAIVATAKRSTIACLEGLLVTADEKLEITGYDLETAITVEVDTDIQEKGSAVFPAKLFASIIQSLPEDVVTIAVDNDCRAKIKSGICNFSIVVLSVENYPNFSVPNPDHSFSISQSVFKDMIQSTVFAAGTNINRPNLLGCSFEVQNDSLTIVAIDGYRLAVRKEMITADSSFSFVLSVPSLKYAQKTLSATDETITVFLDAKHAAFHTNNICVVFRLLESNFTDWRSVLRDLGTKSVEVNCKDLQNSLARVGVLNFSSDKNKSRVTCTFESNMVRLTVANTRGNAYDECQISGDCDGLQIAFNADYFRDALAAVPTDNCIIRLNDSVNPAVICPLEGDRYFYLVMPVRIK